MKIMHVVGARPNFIKLAPVHAALAARPGVEQAVVHTGQHYDDLLSDLIFRQLAMPRPDRNLGVGSGSHAVQTAAALTGLETAMLDMEPDMVLVYGDVNSTLAAALAAAKLGVAVAHVEAGLRSRDRTMPEELNRLLVDRLADLLFTPSADADENLLAEGAAPERVHLVGNVMIDSLVRLLPAAEAAWPGIERALGLAGRPFALVTLHRPANVDHPAVLRPLMAALCHMARDLALVFPAHPRTQARLQALGPLPANGPRIIDPLGYLEILALQKHAAYVVTDSGGIQEETTFLGVPCLTVRPNTERPVTLTLGTNRLVGQDPDALRLAAADILAGRGREGGVPPLWDGRAGERIADVLTHGRIPAERGYGNVARHEEFHVRH
jgi:UDP-N-acetylglucosamine 2-epimerase (non-hydrolysing)